MVGKGIGVGWGEVGNAGSGMLAAVHALDSWMSFTAAENMEKYYGKYQARVCI